MARTKLGNSGIILTLPVSGFLFFGVALRLHEGKVLIATDLHGLFLPITSCAFTTFRADELPLWNPYLLLLCKAAFSFITIGVVVAGF